MPRVLTPDPTVASIEATALDARRYRRLRILGCALAPVPGFGTVADGRILTTTNLDEYVDLDLKNHVSRGEAESVGKLGIYHHAHAWLRGDWPLWRELAGRAPWTDPRVFTTDAREAATFDVAVAAPTGFAAVAALRLLGFIREEDHSLRGFTILRVR